jgi:Glutaredoxin-like domain (DUF836)
MGVAPLFELVTREGCHLCDEMEAVLDPVLQEHGLALGKRDVDQEPALARRYTDVVPVLLRDGRPVAKIRLSIEEARRLIRRRR